MVTEDKHWLAFKVLKLSDMDNGCKTSKYALNFNFPIIAH